MTSENRKLRKFSEFSVFGCRVISCHVMQISILFSFNPPPKIFGVFGFRMSCHIMSCHADFHFVFLQPSSENFWSFRFSDVMAYHVMSCRFPFCFPSTLLRKLSEFSVFGCHGI